MRQSSPLNSLFYASAAFVLLGASGASANTDIDLRDVASGTIKIDKVDASHTKIGTSDKAIGNFNNFGVAEGGSVGVDIAGGGNALFRVVGGNTSDILGNLSVNGKLMLVNPNGVFFGANSRVDVGSLIASTADMADSDFLAGKMNFSKAGKAGASIVNKGTITAADGGLVALIAPSVRNDGVIEANLGTVALASAETASVDFYGDNLYSFALNGKTTAVGVDENGNAVKSAVENNGLVKASGGKVLLTANVAKGVVDNVINNTGIIEASSAHVDGGAIVLDGGDGKVRVSGKLAATGNKGGSIAVTGDEIEVTKANIDVSGKAAGGSVKIGGDYQGGGTLKHAKKVTVDADSKIDVSAKETGNGGQAVVWSDELTDFNGSIVGKGGSVSGNGGSAEVSSKGELGFAGSVDLSAANGKSGTLLLDPADLFIGAFIDHFVGTDHFINAGTVASVLNGGTSVVLTALHNIVSLTDIAWSSAASLTMDAGNRIAINANLTSTFAGGTGAEGGINLNAGDRIALGSAQVTTVRGDIQTTSTDFKMDGSLIKSTNGTVNIDNSGSFGSNTANSIFGKHVFLRQNGTGILQNAIDAIGFTIGGDANLKVGAGSWTEALTIDQNNFTLDGNGAGSTIINSPFPALAPVITANNTKNVTVSNLSVVGGDVGVQANNTEAFKLLNTSISDALFEGLELIHTHSALISGNSFNDNWIGVYSADSVFEKIYGNSFNNGATGVVFNNVSQSRISNGLGVSNSFNNLDTGVAIGGGSSVVVSNNFFTDVFEGVYSNHSTGLHVDKNHFNFDSEFGNGGDAIHNDGGVNFTAAGNIIDNYDNGIVVLGTDRTSVINNTITNSVTDGIYVGSLFEYDDYEGDFEAFFFGTETPTNNAYIADNTVVDAFHGIHVDGVNQATVLRNDVSGAFNGNLSSFLESGVSGLDLAAIGLKVENTQGLYVIKNTLHSNTVGSLISDSSGATFNDNVLTSNSGGAGFIGSDNVVSNTNRFVNNSYGGYGFLNSNDLVSTGDTITGSQYGLYLDNSSRAFIDAMTITSPSGDEEFGPSIGIQMVNGSGGNLVHGPNLNIVRGLTITGGDIGIYIDGEDSAMQFDSNTSRFTGQGQYFVLDNGAMFNGGSVLQADSLDASQQFFEGVRASDFTPAQLAAAEGKTIDVEDGIPTLGNVFYKAFAATTFGNEVNGGFFQKLPQQNPSLFSFNGFTIDTDLTVNPPSFDPTNLNLSLLAPAAGGNGGNGGNVGGNLGALEPSAGGTPADLGSLEPSAGGNNNNNTPANNAGEGSCGNNYLSIGFNTGFSNANCTITVAQQ